MRIDGVERPKNSSPKQAAKKAAGGDFSAFLNTADEVSQPAAAAPTMAATSLLFVQEAAAESVDANQRKQQNQQAVQHGRSVLDMLEQVRLGILSGQIPADRAYRLAQQAKQNIQAADPELQSLLNEIETRALVELAKMGLVP